MLVPALRSHDNPGWLASSRRPPHNSIREVCFVLTTAALKLSELLSGPFQLNVPVYQRPYSWAASQVQQLIDDLLEASGLGSRAEADESYFLGNILLMDAPGNKTLKITPKMTPREFDVVDGQQRLVTLLTMFCVMRDLETAPKKPLGKLVQNMVLAQQGSRFFRTERFRMHLSSRDRAIFEEFVLPENSTTLKAETALLSLSERAVLAMRDLVTSEMMSLSPEDRGTLFEYITEKCEVVAIVSHDIDRAHRMFVVLNERGKQLQRDDILKADILSRVASVDINWVAETWDKTAAELGANFEAFFSHLRKIYGYDDGQVVSGVRSVIADAGGAEPFINTVLVPLARTYKTILDKGAPGLPAGISERLKYLNRLADGDWAPAAMLALQNWQRDPDRAAMLIAEIDRMAHLTRLLCAGTGKRSRRFNAIVDVIRSGAAIDERHPVFQLTREETRSITFHLKDLHKRGPKICKLLLLRLGDTMGGQIADVNPEAYTIEHILPQRPSATSEWRRLFPTAEDRSQCVESLGNLVLITQDQNDKARNASFEAKKIIYASAPDRAPLLPITADVLSLAEWRRDEIEEREMRLLAMVANLWRIDAQPAKPAGRAKPVAEGSAANTSIGRLRS
jgi:Protein of unknown function DUF262/Protein of unknown function (DUF1524)